MIVPSTIIFPLKIAFFGNYLLHTDKKIISQKTLDKDSLNLVEESKKVCM